MSTVEIPLPGNDQNTAIWALETQPLVSAYADTIENVATGDPVTASAPLGVSPNTTGLLGKYLNDTTASAYKWTGRIPDGATTLVHKLLYEVETAPGVVKTVAHDAQGRSHKAGEASSAYSAAQSNTINIATTASRPEEVSFTYAIADLNLQAGSWGQIVFSRDPASDNLVDSLVPIGAEYTWT